MNIVRIVWSVLALTVYCSVDCVFAGLAGNDQLLREIKCQVIEKNKICVYDITFSKKITNVTDTSVNLAIISNNSVLVDCLLSAVDDENGKSVTFLIATKHVTNSVVTCYFKYSGVMYKCTITVIKSDADYVPKISVIREDEN